MPSPLNQDINAFAPGNSCGPFNLLYMYDMEKKSNNDDDDGDDNDNIFYDHSADDDITS